MTVQQLPLFELCDTLPPDTYVAGVDEVGRGCLFGSVVASAVIMPIQDLSQLVELGVTDSKKLSPQRRQALIKPIQTTVTNWQIAQATVAEIDQLNILQASLLAMKRAILKLNPAPQLCLVDGNKLIPDLPFLQETLIQGDLRSPLIGAASILAKVWRDDLIVQLAQDYPQYDLASNKGYGTKKHRLALQKYGVSPHHRQTFRPCRELLSLSTETAESIE